MESIGALSKKLSDYLDPKKVRQVNKAYNFALEAHQNQKREEGVPYIIHPVAVAKILTELKLDSAGWTKIVYQLLCFMMLLKIQVSQKPL